MAIKYPFEFTREDGTHVTVEQIDRYSYKFDTVTTAQEKETFTWTEKDVKGATSKGTIPSTQMDVLLDFWKLQEMY
jgi:hypothetical protein